MAVASLSKRLSQSVVLSKNEGVIAIFVIFNFFFFFQGLDIVTLLGAEGHQPPAPSPQLPAPSPLQVLEGRACSALNF